MEPPDRLSAKPPLQARISLRDKRFRRIPVVYSPCRQTGAVLLIATMLLLQNNLGAATPFEVSEQGAEKIAGLERRVESALVATVKDAGMTAVEKLSSELVKCRDEAKGSKGIESQIDVAIASLDKMVKESGIAAKALADLDAEAVRIKKKLEELKSSLTALGTRLEELNKQTNEWKKIYKLQVAMVGPEEAGKKIRVAAETQLERWREKMMYAKPSRHTMQESFPQPRIDERSLDVRSVDAGPSIATTQTSAPSTADSDAIKRMVLMQLDAEARSDIPAVMSYYADFVDFLNEGVKSRAAIEYDLPAYYAHWPKRHASLIGDIVIRAIGRNECLVLFSIDFEAENPAKREVRASKVDIVWRVRRERSGTDFKIVSYKQKSTPRPPGLQATAQSP